MIDKFDTAPWRVFATHDQRPSGVWGVSEVENPPADAVEDALASPAGVLVDDSTTAPDAVLEVKAKKMANLIVLEGKTLKKAAQEAGIPQRLIMNGEAMRRLVSETLQAAHLEAGVRREFVRAALNQTLAESLAQGDRKGVVDAAKVIAQDPEVGLNLPPQVGVQIDFGPIGDLIKSVNGKPLEELDIIAQD